MKSEQTKPVTGASNVLRYTILSIPQWREQASVAITQGQALNDFLAHCHPLNRTNARNAYLMEAAKGVASE